MERVRPTANILAISIAVLITTTRANADSREDFFTLPMAGGVALASPESAIFENPAALARHTGFAVQGLGFSNATAVTPLGFGGGLLAGTGWLGAGGVISNLAGYSQFDSALALRLWRVSLGAGLSTPLSLVPIAPSLSTGLLVDVTDTLNVGLVSQLSTLVIGLGVSKRWSWFLTAADVAAKISEGAYRFKPGVGMDFRWAQATISYGFDVLGSVSGAPFRSGLSAGLGFSPLKTLRFQILFNQLALLSTSGTLTF